MKWKLGWIVAMALTGLIAAVPGEISAQDGPVERFGEIVTTGRYVLRWGMQQGQKFSVEAVQEMVTEIEGPLGKSGKMPSALTVQQDWEVTESDESSLTLAQTFRKLKLETTIPGAGNFIVVVPGPEPESLIAKQIHANLSELIGRQLRLQMDRLGQVKKFEFLELPVTAEAPEANQFLTQENLKNAVGQMVQFPKSTRAIGETWGTSTKSPQPNGTAEVKTEFTLLETLPDHPRWIKISVAPKLTLSVKDDAVTVDDQSSEGHIVYDDELALVRETYLKQSLTFTVKGENGGKRTIESTMRMKIEPITEKSNDPSR
ncbi:MAG: hypothetical protein Q8M16_23890 [Pirellulaceae bacterium]|nr:hypothetical protein [Pirellulaceae bacterium]